MRLLWAQMRDDALDAAAFAGRVAALKQYQDTVAVGDEMTLQLDELDL